MELGSSVVTVPKLCSLKCYNCLIVVFHIILPLLGGGVVGVVVVVVVVVLVVGRGVVVWSHGTETFIACRLTRRTYIKI